MIWVVCYLDGSLGFYKYFVVITDSQMPFIFPWTRDLQLKEGKEPLLKCTVCSALPLHRISFNPCSKLAGHAFDNTVANVTHSIQIGVYQRKGNIVG